MDEQQLKYGGFCQHCQCNHTLPAQPALQAAHDLIAELETDHSIQRNQSKLSTDILFGHARGQMFGVMVAHDKNGLKHILKAFSGQFHGHYLINGWVPPVFDVNQFNKINRPEEKKIKALSKHISETDDLHEMQQIKKERRNRSRTLMKEIHSLYLLNNFHGQQRPMADFFPAHRGMPTGAGDCCGPKLIQYAIRQHLTPFGMVEFYFGLENKSQTKQHSHFYSSCQSGCAPILGFMLCGQPDQKKR